MNPSSSEPIKLTQQQFANLTAKYAELLETDADVRRKYIGMCGSLERASLFARRKGVGISEFAKLMDVPATTVRHYLRLGLVTPFVINSKFRFESGNVVQFESVRQWHELGMTLEEIVEQRQKNRAAQSVVRPDGDPEKVLTVQRLTDEEYARLEMMFGPDIALKQLTRQQFEQAGVLIAKSTNQTLVTEYKSLREKLEARKAKIEAQLARVSQLEAALSPSQTESPRS